MPCERVYLKKKRRKQFLFKQLKMFKLRLSLLFTKTIWQTFGYYLPLLLFTESVDAVDLKEKMCPYLSIHLINFSRRTYQTQDVI